MAKLGGKSFDGTSVFSSQSIIIRQCSLDLGKDLKKPLLKGASEIDAPTKPSSNGAAEADAKGQSGAPNAQKRASKRGSKRFSRAASGKKKQSISEVGIKVETKEWGAGFVDSDDTTESEDEDDDEEEAEIGLQSKFQNLIRRMSGAAPKRMSHVPMGAAGSNKRESQDSDINVKQETKEWGGFVDSDDTSDDDEAPAKPKPGGKGVQFAVDSDSGSGDGSDGDGDAVPDALKGKLSQPTKAPVAKKKVMFAAPSASVGSVASQNSNGHQVQKKASVKTTDGNLTQQGRLFPTVISVQREERKGGFACTCQLNVGPEHIRFLVIAVLGVLDVLLQVLCLVIYVQHGMHTWIPAVAIQLLGAGVALFITFHDHDVLNILEEAKSETAQSRRFQIFNFGLLLGCCRGIQVKRAWARQVGAAQIATEFNENVDSKSKKGNKDKGTIAWPFGGAEHAMPVALATDVPFLLLNTLVLLAMHRTAWNGFDFHILAAASMVSAFNVLIAICELDLALSSYVVNLYSNDETGRRQFRGPLKHIAFRATEVSLRIMFYAACWWILEPFGTQWIVLAFGVDVAFVIWLLFANAPQEENMVTHLIVGMVMSVADLAHFVDVPNFMVPTRKISFYLLAWRFIATLILICLHYFGGDHLLQRCLQHEFGLESEECHEIAEHGLVLGQLLVAFASVYTVLSLVATNIADDLHTAASIGNAKLVKELMRPDSANQVLDVNALARNGSKTTPAMYATKGGHSKALKKLLARNADTNLQNDDGDTCLHLASRISHSELQVEIVNALLDYGARYNVHNAADKIPEDLCEALSPAYEILKKERENDGPIRTKSSCSSFSGSIEGEEGEELGPAMSIDSDDGPSKVMVRGVFANADDFDTPPVSALHSVSGLVVSRGAGLLASRILGLPNSVPLGSLRRLKELGKGGFGVVIEVELPRHQVAGNLWNSDATSQRFALKLQSKVGSPQSAFSEIQALIAVQHRFVVSLDAHYQTPMFFAMLLEVCPTDLNRLLCKQSEPGERCTGFSEEITAKYLGQVLLALKHLHEMPGGGIIYRDLKPENILINKDDNAKLSDFGLAKTVCKIAEARKGSDDSFTHATTICGTMGFWSPELLDSDLAEDLEGSSSGSEEWDGTFSARRSARKSMVGMEAGKTLAQLQMAMRPQAMSDVSSGGTNHLDVFKLDAYSFGVTLQVVLLGEDGAVRKEIRHKGHMMLPMNVDEEENFGMLRASHGNGRISAEALHLLTDLLLPQRPKDRSRLQAPEVVNHHFFLNALHCDDLKEHLFNNNTKRETGFQKIRKSVWQGVKRMSMAPPKMSIAP